MPLPLPLDKENGKTIMVRDMLIKN